MKKRNSPKTKNPSGTRKKEGAPSTSEESEDRVKLFPVVGIGASAGGLEAFTQLLHALPPENGMALVYVQHLDPTHPSMLAEFSPARPTCRSGKRKTTCRLNRTTST